MRPQSPSWTKYLQCNEESPERAAIFFANHRAAIIDIWMIEGTKHSVSLPVKDIVQKSRHLRACQIMVIHTHPSGNPNPSPQDVTMTRLLAARLRQQRQRLTDHIILTHNRYFSFRSNRML
ncbi:MAG: hypothetical protein E2598_05375 [Sphingobium sp.]|nr:hypothetical protein [Sphingobium sp.]